MTRHIKFQKIPVTTIEEVITTQSQLLWDWIDKVICDPLQLDEYLTIEFTKEHLGDLINDLKSVNDSNCDFYFPHWDSNYDDKYWLEIKTIREWAEQMSEHFNFKENRLMFLGFNID